MGKFTQNDSNLRLNLANNHWRHNQQKSTGIWQGRMLQKDDGSIIALSTLSSYQSPVMETLCRYEQIINNKIQKTEMELLKLRLYQPNEMNAWLHDIGFSSIRQLKIGESITSTQEYEMVVYECVK